MTFEHRRMQLIVAVFSDTERDVIRYPKDLPHVKFLGVTLLLMRNYIGGVTSAGSAVRVKGG
jgi:hypothetical protein